jgi:hypothetical protein
MTVDVVPQPSPKLHGPYTDEDLHLMVMRGWCRLPSRQVRRERTLREYFFGWHFVASVERAPVDMKVVIQTILQIVCRSASPNDGAVFMPLPDKQRGPLDAVAAWWHGLEGEDGLGIHYVELRSGQLTLLTLADLDDQPNPSNSQ